MFAALWQDFLPPGDGPAVGDAAGADVGAGPEPVADAAGPIRRGRGLRMATQERRTLRSGAGTQVMAPKVAALPSVTATSIDHISKH